MKKSFISLFLISASALSMMSLNFINQPKALLQDPEKNYTQYCSSCHGGKSRSICRSSMETWQKQS